ncbi:PKD domain-containing protein [Chloroflexota bacterium]
MRKFLIILVLLSLVISMGTTVQAAPPEGGPPGLERALAAQEAHTDRLLNIPGVVGTGVGLNHEGKAAVKILTESTGVARLPKSLDSVPVEVVVTGKFYARYDPKDWQDRPVPIGVSTGHPDVTAGTIGARVINAAGNVYALSNNHVYANANDAAPGDSALQPGSIDGGTDPADKIGTLYDFEALKYDGSVNTMDAAIAISSEALLDNKTLPDGYGMPNSYDPSVQASIGLPVQKYGRTTGQTYGTVDAINVSVSVCYESRGKRCIKSAWFEGQILVTPGTFSDGGDSGSLIVTNDDNKNPVGLLFAGSSAYTIANPIGPVLERFGVDIDSEPSDLTPSVSIVSPTDGSTVSGTVPVTADASDDNGVTQVEFFIDYSSIGVDTDGIDGWSAAWDTTTQYIDGNYTVTATATDTVGQTNSDSIVVAVDNVNDPPMASFTYTSNGLTCNFDASGSDDPDGSIVAYDWTFGDGNTSSGITTAHTYASTGTYDVSLTVTDNDGANDTESQTVTVSDAVATMHVGDLDASTRSIGRSGKWVVTVTVTIDDGDHQLVSGATVYGTWSGDTGGDVSGITGGDGTVTFTTGTINGGSSVSFTVDNVSEILTYFPSDNHDEDGDSDGTTITVSK